jgi:hypothetical protein
VQFSGWAGPSGLSYEHWKTLMMLAGTFKEIRP